jgi:LysR family glycine cleavage system transcriptional activator
VLTSKSINIWWEQWFNGVEVHPPAMAGASHFESLSLSYQAARGDGGVAMGVLALIADDLANGRLVVPFPVVMKTQTTYRLVQGRGRSCDPTVATFRAWLLDEVSRTNTIVTNISQSFKALN